MKNTILETQGFKTIGAPETVMSLHFFFKYCSHAEENENVSLAKKTWLRNWIFHAGSVRLAFHRISTLKNELQVLYIAKCLVSISVMWALLGSWAAFIQEYINQN